MSDQKLTTDASELAIDPDAAPRLAASRHWASRWVLYVLVGVVGFVLYWVSDLLFQRYITVTWSWVLVVAVSVTALVAWIIDEVRSVRRS
jgi:uncharacterized membrane protein YcjF (UPF0283 family)